MGGAVLIRRTLRRKEVAMTQEEREAEHQWTRKMIALEEERGPIVPGGAVGGISARARRAAQGKAAASTAMRVRSDVRFLAYAVGALEEQAA
jgi:hypothetical protein